MEKITDFEIGYVCGLLDAEGSITMQRQELIRKKEDGTKLLFYNPKIHINMNHKKTMDYLHEIFVKAGLKHSHFGPDNQKRYNITLRDASSFKKFWGIFDCLKRIKRFESYIGCILDESN